MSADTGLPSKTQGLIEIVMHIATKVTALGAVCCIVLVAITEGASLLAIWNLILPVMILLGIRPWALMSSSFRPLGAPALAFCATALFIIMSSHIGAAPHDLRLEGGNHLAALFLLQPLAAALYGLAALIVTWVLGFLVRRMRAVKSERLKHE